jgi:putative multiple sugar transport system substrate-binding protein
VLPSGWFQGEQARFQEALKGTGYSAQILSSRDVATEKAAVEALIGRGIKVLILTPQDGAAAAAVADAARAAGVKVIANDRLILDTASLDYYVTFDNVATGAAQAQYLIDKAGATKGNNLYLYAGAASDSNPFLLLEGAWEKLQPRIADGTFVIRNSSVAVALQDNPTLTRDQQSRIISQITTDWNPNTARYMAQSDLIAAPAAAKGTVFILAPNDATARAIADVFAADKDVRTYYVTGQDADKTSVQYMIDGRQDMTVFKDSRTRVEDVVAAAVAFLTGGTPAATTTLNNGAIDVPSALLSSVTVTRANIQAALIDTGYYRASDFTGSWPGKP